MASVFLPPAAGVRPPTEVGGTSASFPEEPAFDDAVDLREVLSVLRKHLILVAAVTLIVTGIGAAFAYLSRPVYQADAVIRIADTRNQMTAGLEDPIIDQALGPRTDPVLSQIQVLESRTVAGQVVQRHPLGLRVIPISFPPSLLRSVTLDSLAAPDTLSFEFDDSSFTFGAGSQSLRARYGRPLHAAGLAFTLGARPDRSSGQIVIASDRVAIDRFLVNLDAKARQNTDVIDVSYKDHDPVIAQQVVNTAIRTFQETNAINAQEQSRRRREFVGAQLAQTDSVLEQAQLALSSFASSKQVYGSDQVIAAQQSGLMDLDVKRGELIADRSVYQTLLDSIQRATGPGLTERLNTIVSSPGIAQNPVVLALYQQLVTYEGIHDSLTAGPWAIAPSSPDVKRIEALIATTQQRLKGATRSQIDALTARITALDELKSSTASGLQKLPATQAAEARLVQRVEASRKVSDQLREEYQKARIEEAVEAGQVEIVDDAPLPLVPIGTGRMLKTLLALILGLVFGAGAAFIAEHLNTSIQRRDEIETLLRIPGLAIVPRILPSRGLGQLAGAAIPRLASGARPSNNVINSDTRLVAANDRHSAGAEAFRTLRTNLVFSQAVQSLHVIGTTSAGPGEGKTTTTANLAVTFAQQGMRVVIVDCDLRRPRLHEMFAQSREPGLTSVLAGQVDLESVIRSTLIDNLSFIPAGVLPPNPAELLGGARMKTVLTQLRERYDIVLVDMPPVHAAADALVVGREADGVLMVVRAGSTDRGAAQDAMRSLVGVGAHVVGAVLNDPDHKVPVYGGYYYSDYYGSDVDAASEAK